MKMNFSVVNWNVAGTKILKGNELERSADREELARDIKWLLEGYKPHVVTLQEVVRYREPLSDEEFTIKYKEFEEYRFFSFSIFDSDHRSPAPWDSVRDQGGWHADTFFSQENAMLIRNDVELFRVLDLSGPGESAGESEESCIEQINLETGLYLGDRSTEPRAALVAHFVLSPADTKKPVDIFVVNLHLTTLKGEREGIPQIEAEAERIRRAQLDVVFYGIVSRYNKWRQEGYPIRGKPREQHCDRYPPIWIVAGDFNFTPESQNYTTIKRMNFEDMVPVLRTKTKGRGNRARIKVDYIFAGPVFTSLDPLVLPDIIEKNGVDYAKKSSDHYPLHAEIPLPI